MYHSPQKAPRRNGGAGRNGGVESERGGMVGWERMEERVRNVERGDNLAHYIRCESISIPPSLPVSFVRLFFSYFLNGRNSIQYSNSFSLFQSLSFTYTSTED